MLTKRMFSCTCLLGLFASQAVSAAIPKLEVDLLTKDNMELLCLDSKVSQRRFINALFFIGKVPADLMTDNFSQKDVHQILSRGKLDDIKTLQGKPATEVISEKMLTRIVELSDGIGNFLVDGHKKTKLYTLENPNNLRGRRERKRGLLEKGTLGINCIQQDQQPESTGGGDDGSDDKKSRFKLLVRANPEDLTVTDAAAFKKLDHAGITIDDNKGADKTTVSANFTLGSQLAIPTKPYLFVKFESSIAREPGTEPDPDNPDETIAITKTTRTETISPGLLWKAVEWTHTIPFIGVGSWGATIKPTFDLEHNAEYGRVKLWAKPSLSLGDDLICQENMDLGPFSMRCDTEFFAEYADIFDAGTNTELVEKASNNFIGVGGEVSAKFRIKDNKLPGFYLKGKYRFMGVFGGKLGDQERYELAAGYTLPTTENVAMELSYIKGENIETYLAEEQLKLQFGVKF